MKNGNKIVALLPIKENSERIKGKNFRDLSGKPLYRWVLDTLLDVDDIDQVIINTDAIHLLNKKILPDSKRLHIRNRKHELQGDSVSMNLIIEDDIMAVKSDIYLMTHATNPLLTSETINSAIDTFISSTENDSLFSVNKVQTRFYRNDMSAVNHDPENLIPTQELEPWYEENSCLYIFTEESFRNTNARIGKNPLMYETSALESIDIDIEEDWIMAEALANRAHEMSR